MILSPPSMISGVSYLCFVRSVPRGLSGMSNSLSCVCVHTAVIVPNRSFLCSAGTGGLAATTIDLLGAGATVGRPQRVGLKARGVSMSNPDAELRPILANLAVARAARCVRCAYWKP